MIERRYTNPGDVSQIDVVTITAATATINVAAYSLTHPAVCAALIGRAQAGVKIRLYLDRTELEAEARGNPQLSNSPLGPLLSTVNVQTKVKESRILMHLKSYVVDGKVLRDGSANFSPLGESEQDNSIELTDDPASVQGFQAKFETMWNRPDNISVAQAVASPQRMNSTAHRSH
jgi:phosphatidylserine/phosphatidylglycerophosphate/cardiolipin synthase-like enzyme